MVIFHTILRVRVNEKPEEAILISGMLTNVLIVTNLQHHIYSIFILQVSYELKFAAKMPHPMFGNELPTKEMSIPVES